MSSAEQTYLRAPTAVSCSLGDGSAILDSATNRYFSLNSVGALVWDALPEPAEAIAKRIVDLFDVGYDLALNDVRNILAHFAREGLVQSTSLGDT